MNNRDYNSEVLVGMILFILQAMLFCVLLACEKEPIKVQEPIGCECNDGIKLDFSKPILPGFIESDKFEAKHCNGGQYTTCGVMVIILDHKGFKRFIYDSREFN